MSLLEIVIRGVLVYVSVCLLLRVVLKRQAGRASLSDLLVVSLVAGVCRNPLVRDAYSITDGMSVVAMVLACSFATDWLSYYVPFVHRLTHSPPRPLIQDGQVIQENLQRELMTEKQLLCKLRRAGVRGPEEVEAAYLEGDGENSVIPKRDCDRTPVQVASQVQVPAGDGAGAVAEFLRAADRLQDQLACHQRGIAEIRAALTEHGVRIRRAAPTAPHPARNGVAKNAQ
jgi:uncharacterized membrane protein YcaP (DUF421 family)